MSGSSEHDFGWKFDQNEEWGDPEELLTNEELEERISNVDFQSSGWGNENFSVLGSQFLATPEYHGLLDRDIETLDTYKTGIKDDIGDIIVSERVWNSIEPRYKTVVERAEKADDHYQINFRSENSGDSYSGFLRVEEEGYDVVLETRQYDENLSGETFVGFPFT